MREYPTQNIIHVLAEIEAVKQNVVHHKGKDEGQTVSKAIPDGWPDSQRKVCQKYLHAALPFLPDLELETAKEMCMSLAGEITDKLSYDHVISRSDGIRAAIASQLQRRKLFAIDAKHTRYYNNPTLAGDKFKTWKKANTELMEAGNCLALGRYTACACHLMRATEYALRAFETALGIVPKTRDTWGAIIGEIETHRGQTARTGKAVKIAAVSPSPAWQKNPDIYEACYANLVTLKNRCRDKVFHVKVSYDEDEAQKLFDAVAVFLTLCADHLKKPA